MRDYILGMENPTLDLLELEHILELFRSDVLGATENVAFRDAFSSEFMDLENYSLF